MQFLITQLKSASVMSIAIWFSVIMHAIILSIHFEPELKKFADRLPVLEVMLVNAKTQTTPDKTDIRAQANLDRGGNTDLDRVMKSALPALKPQQSELSLKPTAQAKSSAAATTTEAAITKEEKRVKDLEIEAQKLLTQLDASNQVESQTAAIDTAPALETAPNQNAPKKLDLDAISAAALEMDKLEALIAKQQDDYQKRPKRKFVGARAKEYKYAMYVDAWRQKVEKIGNLNYPEAAKNQKLYGKLQMTVSIKADGSVEDIEVNRSSGHKILDEAAKRIVYLGAPYAQFTDDIRREIDVLSITRTWTFTQEDAIASE